MTVSQATAAAAAAECPPVIPAEDQTHVATGETAIDKVKGQVSPSLVEVHNIYSLVDLVI